MPPEGPNTIDIESTVLYFSDATIVYPCAKLRSHGPSPTLPFSLMNSHPDETCLTVNR